MCNATSVMTWLSERQGQRKNKKGTNMQSHDAFTVKGYVIRLKLIYYVRLRFFELMHLCRQNTQRTINYSNI